MKLKSVAFVSVLGFWTAFTLAGSVWVWLFLLGPNSITRLDLIRSNNILVLLIVALTVFLCGGGLWGLGIARLMNADATSMVIACALSWSATVFTFAGAISFWGISLGSLSQLAYILPYFPHSHHYSFLLIFVPVIGIVTAINGYVVTGKLGFKELRKSVGLYAGLAAALGFLTVGLILLFGLGWGVGERPGKMLSLLELCNIGAALAGGMALGWALNKSRIRLDG
ncbi:MAG: hypothetical protein EHM33_09980 [Chloroflexi bacterium]|nr:MAG: hypothetical protein EHM33_09980 [Chloroflexota bacterium]